MNGTTLRGVEYAFPQASRTVRELASEGLLLNTNQSKVGRNVAHYYPIVIQGGSQYRGRSRICLPG